MQINVKGKNVDVTPALRAHAEKKASKFEKFFAKRPLEAQVTLSIERGFHICDITLLVEGLLLRGEERSGDMYVSIDSACEKVERQIQKYKTRINHKLRQDGNTIVDEPADDAHGNHEEIEPRIVRTKRFNLKPMSVDEAAMQMDLLGHDFYVFTNSETESLGVVYRRKDGSYGLIEPEI